MLPVIPYAAFAAEPHIGSAAVLAERGDWLAALAVKDWMEEQGVMIKSPFDVGKSYLICTQTLYYVGRVVEGDLGWVRLEGASWVHRTGRLSVLIEKQSFTDPALASRIRTEICGEVFIALASVVSAYPWTGELPERAIP